MPNLDYDPQNPSDLMGRPIAVGDTVAWGTTYGKSAALCVCTIEKINFSCLKPEYSNQGGQRYYNNAGMYMPCTQRMAERYTLTVRPIKSTGRVSEGSDGQPKLKTFLHVKNIVKLDPLT